MNSCQMKFRNQLAVNLTKILVPHIFMNETLVDRSFAIADYVCARIKADAEAMQKAQAEERNTEYEEMLATLRPGKIESGKDRDPRQNPEAAGQLRRAEDMIEVHEVSVEQALDMIASLLHAAKH